LRAPSIPQSEELERGPESGSILAHGGCIDAKLDKRVLTTEVIAVGAKRADNHRVRSSSNPHNSLEFKGGSMKSLVSVPFRFAWVGLFVLVLSPSAAFAQDNSSLAAGLGMGIIFFVVLVGLAGYVYVSLALQTIANKTNTANAWLAWIPIANIFLMLSVAKKPMWWFLLFLVPLVNIVFGVIVWMAIAEARGKPNWWGILVIVPVANLVVPGVLAWAD
jgi:uncharacterized protein DUF5684